MIKGQGYVGIQYIIDRVLDIFPRQDIEFGSMVRAAADAMLLIGSFKSFERGYTDPPLKVNNHRADLPDGIVYIDTVRYCDTGENMRYSSNAFHSKFHKKDSPDLYSDSDLTYTINRYQIFTSFEEGEIEIAYVKMPLDEEGYPLIPNDIKFIKAVEAAIIERIGRKLYYMGRITDNVWFNIQQEYAWYMGAAQARGNMPSHDEMQTLSNMMVRLIERPMTRQRYFTDTGSQETLNL